MLVGFNAWARGYSHIAKDKPCQDAANYWLHNGLKRAGIAVVADGHGGEKYFRSKTGSKFAVKIAIKVIREFYERFNPVKDRDFLEKNVERIKQNIIRLWRIRVVKDIRQNAWTSEERTLCDEKRNINLDDENTDKLISIYGTTLVAALITDDLWFAIQIGDGACVLINRDDKAEIVITPDDEQSFGYTHSICSPNAAEKFKHRFGNEGISGLTVATDGVSDSFLPDKYLEFNRTLRENFVRDAETTRNELKNYLPRLSEQGSRDDMAIAGIFDLKEK